MRAYVGGMTAVLDNIAHQFFTTADPFSMDYLASFLGSFGGASLGQTAVLDSSQGVWALEVKAADLLQLR